MMNYEAMLTEVCHGKTAYRPTNPDVIVFREGDTIIRRSYRGCEVNQVFIASVEEIKAHDWEIVADEQEEDQQEWLIAHSILVIDVEIPPVPHPINIRYI